jgi:hypothetical protein
MKLWGACVLGLLLIAGAVFALRREQNHQALAALQTGYELAGELRTPANEVPSEGGQDQKTKEANKEADQEEVLLKLKTIDDTHPELQPRFDGIIASEMVARQKRDSIDPYARRALGRLEMELPLFAQFSEMCRLSGLCEYSEALAAAYRLRETLSAAHPEQSSLDPTLGPTDLFLLEASTLLEIAALEKQLHKNEACQKTLCILKETIARAAANPDLAMQQAHMRFIQLLEDRYTSLLDYFSKAIS